MADKDRKPVDPVPSDTSDSALPPGVSKPPAPPPFPEVIARVEAVLRAAYPSPFPPSPEVVDHLDYVLERVLQEAEVQGLELPPRDIEILRANLRRLHDFPTARPSSPGFSRTVVELLWRNFQFLSETVGRSEAERVLRQTGPALLSKRKGRPRSALPLNELIEARRLQKNGYSCEQIGRRLRRPATLIREQLRDAYQSKKAR
jgi:hypothetical protein